MLEDLGFADVDPDVIGQLVMYLEKHVTLAASVDVIQESYGVAKQLQSQESPVSMEEVRSHWHSCWFVLMVLFCC